MKKETIIIKTTNGSVRIERSKTNATITQERICFGFKETCTTTVTKLNDDCTHYVFGKKEDLINQFKNS